MTEIFKDISGYKGLYQISNLGRVKRLARKQPHAVYGTMDVKEIILSPGKSAGYWSVSLTKNGEMKSIRVHRLICEAFIPNPEGKDCVNHIDGNKLNNSIENLEWVTYSENHKHAFRTGLKKHVQKLSILLLLISLSGCITQKKIDEICSKCPSKSFIKDSVIVKDSIIYSTLHPDPIFLPNPCSELCDSMGRLKTSFKPRITHNKGLTATIRVSGDTLQVICHEDSLKEVIRAIRSFRYEHVEKRLEVYKTTRLQDFWIVSGQGGWGLLILLVAYLVARWYNKYHLPK